MAVPKFEYFHTRAAFDTARGATTVFNNSVVFIEDTMELFTHGHFWTVSNLSQYYNSSTQKLQLKNGSTVISELDASPFIKDGMLENVELITTPESGSTPSLTVVGDSVNGVLPIVTLDADTFEYDSNAEKYLIPVADQQNKAFSISNCAGKEFYFNGRPATDGNIAAVKLDAVSSIGYVDDIPSETVNQWVAFPDWGVENFGGDYYGFENNYDWDEAFHDGYTVTESSGSNYPTLPYLKFTFNTFDSEPTHTVIRVSIAELFTVYNGDNVLLSSNYAKAQTYVEPAVGDKVDIAVGKLAKGVADNAAAIATKQATITGAATSITSNNLTASRVLVSDANGKVAVSNVTSTELGYVSGVTSSIQTQLNAKANIADLGWVEH